MCEPLIQDEQSDSGMVLQSEELKHVAWNNSTKSKKLSRCWPLTCDLLTFDLWIVKSSLGTGPRTETVLI